MPERLSDPLIYAAPATNNAPKMPITHCMASAPVICPKIPLADQAGAHQPIAPIQLERIARKVGPTPAGVPVKITSPLPSP